MTRNLLEIGKHLMLSKNTEFYLIASEIEKGRTGLEDLSNDWV